MTAEEIRKILTDRQFPERGSAEWVRLVFMCEIAAQLAELNAKTLPSPVQKLAEQLAIGPLFGHNKDCSYRRDLGETELQGPNFCGFCGGYIGK